MMLIYKVVASNDGFKGLEREVSLLLNKGWNPVGGIAFNQGHCYQSMVGNVNKTTKKQPIKDKLQTIESNSLGATDAMKRIDDLT